MYRFLLIEDAQSDIDAFETTIKRLNYGRSERLYDLVVAKTYEDGLQLIKDSYNGVIVDINLGEKSGNDIVCEIMEKYRLPVAIFTGTPDTPFAAETKILVFKKGEVEYSKILEELCAVSDTGMFSVLGGTGIIENVMTKVFWSNLYPQVDIWKEKKRQGIDTEKVLLRYVVSHIQELIDNDIPAYITEEMYIAPPVTEEIRTGGIYRSQKDGMNCIVLSPPCDLAIHDGKIKTDRILVCEIENQKDILDEVLSSVTSGKKRKEQIKKMIKNNYTDYYHWLPSNSLYEGGYINFRKVITYPPEEFVENFGKANLKVQEYFVKNILNRFSAYYARQGQPDFDFSEESELLCSRMFPQE